MKKYTTLLCLLLALVMVMACFTGCAKQPAQSDPRRHHGACADN